MDFVSNVLLDGRRLRALTVVDAFTREALAIDVGQGIKSEQVVEAMPRVFVDPWCAEDHSRGQWAETHLESARPLGGAARGSCDAQHRWNGCGGVRGRHDAGLQSTR